MHIKQIIIQGFKSYKDQTVIEPFSPKHNVIVGRNGSGKSNFFWAIRFVLSDAYSSMTREERQALLHEGNGPVTLSAFVEVIFDNSDNRFPTGKEELILRRTIGLKKDEYSLDKKSATKTDVMNLLESAGFSRSNPYYIVPQGRIMALTNAKDAERLTLLKEVAGTEVYEQRRTESLKIITETELKRQKIEELLAYIEERLKELDEEKEELKKFKELDRDRRCFEYTIYSREQEEVNFSLEELELQRRDDMDAAQEENAQIDELEQTIVEQENELNEQTKHHQDLNLEQASLDDEIQGYIKIKAQLEMHIRDLEDNSTRNEFQKSKMSEELKTLESEIQMKQQELGSILPAYEDVSQKEVEVKAKVNASEIEKSHLYAKQGRTAQFQNQKERDRYLKKEIQESKHLLQLQSSQIHSLEREIELFESDLEKLNSAMDFEKDGQSRENAFSELETKEKELRLKRGQLDETRKDLWRQEARLLNSLEALREDYKKAERNVFCKMDRATGQGLESVRKIAKRLNLSQQVHGPLYELFNLNERYMTCVEAIAGSSLFHVVVDSDVTATAILEVMNKEKSGRVTFMPLNRLKPKDTSYPSSSDAIPMIKKLQFDSKYLPAIKQVFGKAIICQSLDVASNYARTQGLNAVTLDGDRADKKGALTGGFVDLKRSRLDAAKHIKKITEKLREMEETYSQMKRDIATTEQQIMQIRDEMSLINNQRQKLMASFQDEKKDSEQKADRIAQLKEDITQRKQSLKTLESQSSSTEDQIKAYEEELKMPMTNRLSAEEEKRLSSTIKTCSNLEKELSELGEKRLALQSRKGILEIQLNSNLKKQKAELESRLAQVALPSRSMLEIGAKKQELKSTQIQMDKLMRQSEQVISELEEVGLANSKLEQALENSRVKLCKIQSSVQNQIRKNEKYLSKKALLIKKKEELIKNIRDLGVLPEEAFEKYKDMDSKKVVKKLHTVKEGLKKLSHVNKKAFEQYNNFTKQRETLQARRSELDASAKSIEDLIQVLDQRKDEAIQRTFKHVAKNFSEIWTKLVNRGKGQLIMLKKSDMSQDQDEQDEIDQSQRHHGAIEHYIGIAIQVSFNASTEAAVRMTQLSGGQKSLVALALIFAIQRCDPAPFYLFDEIDAALDAQYRTAVANMIRELSEQAQFITTTFRPEMLTHADKFYGVTFVNKVSRIQVITKDQAKEFVEQEQPQ